LPGPSALVRNLFSPLLNRSFRNQAQVALPHDEPVGCDLTSDERRAEPGGGLNHDPIGPAGDGIGGEQHAGGIRRYERLDDHRHSDGQMIEAVLHAIIPGSIGP
jgi:hypothetical protein